MSRKLVDRIADRSARVSIIGLGYVGLPLAIEFCRAGFSVTGIDVDPAKVRQLNDGISYVEDIPNAVLQEALGRGFRATTDYGMLAGIDCVSICVPTPLNKTKDPDMSYILSAIDEIVKHFHRGQLIVLESTTYPGTTDEVILPRLEGTGLHVGEDFYLAFSPERIDPGNKVFTTRNTPKIIGGVTPACTAAAQALYGTAIEQIVPVSSTRAAEMVKLLENTFRAVNIALANEVAIMSDKLKIDVWEVIEAAATKPFGFMPFYPGPGLGGHCIPIDPHYLSWKLKTLNYNARFIELASDINAKMPEYVVRRATAILNDLQKSVNGSRILILGASYKRDVGDLRESPALEVMNLLLEGKAILSYHDPFIPEIRLGERTLCCVELSAETLSAQDLVIVVTDHAYYDMQWITDHATQILDTRNATRNVTTPKATITRL
ncbi:MAG: nucleotide sugar dehydrogenase [Deltaproteobacteria bacterium]|nr:MAG: nucleotide sugar dehydrogenase [Deltaproteobacteria bacterium]